VSSTKGSLTNYVDKKRWVGSPKVSTFVNVYKVENVNVEGYSYNSIKRTCFIKQPGLEFFKNSLLNVPYNYLKVFRKQLNVLVH
jgi:hypothetical protein